LERWSTKNVLSPNEVSYGSIAKVIWECDKGHSWTATPNKITQKDSSGCPYCANQKVWVGYNDLKTFFPELSEEWNYSKNGEITPDKITVHSNKKVWWLCPAGHEYQATVTHRTRSSRRGGCPFCVNKKLLVGFNDLATVCPDVASEWHPTKNGNLKPYDVLSSTAQQIWWLCPQGHEYKSSLNSRVLNGKRKSGCPICAGKMIVAGENDLQSQSPHIAKEWHPTKNGDVTPDMVGNGSHKKYWWLCPIGHEYLASPENRTKVRGTGVLFVQVKPILLLQSKAFTFILSSGSQMQLIVTISRDMNLTYLFHPLV
jgi:hypothetical protein